MLSRGVLVPQVEQSELVLSQTRSCTGIRARSFWADHSWFQAWTAVVSVIPWAHFHILLRPELVLWLAYKQ